MSLVGRSKPPCAFLINAGSLRHHRPPDIRYATRRVSVRQPGFGEAIGDALCAFRIAERQPSHMNRKRVLRIDLLQLVPGTFGLFVLAKVASFKGDMEGAQADFQKAADSAKDPHVVAWSHIYLGRIYDIQGERDSAVAQYKAALAISDVPADAKTTAEKGLQQAYQTPRSKDENQ